MPYCKTYEEIRLEEIQAESAAYYSYQMEDHQSEACGDKARARGDRKASPYSRASKEANGDKSLNFEVLSLEEIRRRKRRKETSQSAGQLATDGKEESTNLSEEAIRTLPELSDMPASRGVKRTLEDYPDDTSKCKARRNAVSPLTSAPPVKLRRSPKRFTAAGDTDRWRHAEDSARSGPDSADRSCPAETGLQRLNSNESTESAGVAKRNEVEIRLCDSSTDEDQSLVDTSEDRKGVHTDRSKDHNCDSLLNVNDEDYLTLDMASDDILKDIDALLKEKTEV